MKKLMKCLIIVATLSCMLLAVAASAMAYNLEASPGEGPASGTANENSFLFTPITIDDVTVAIGGNGNSARLIVTVKGIDYVSNTRPENNMVNTVVLADIKYEVDVFVRGNKIDGDSIVIHDLNCYNECPNIAECTPQRFNPCECDPDDCACEFFCEHKHKDVTCNVTEETCDNPVRCGEDCDRPTNHVDCKKIPANAEWECPWVCECYCECEDEGDILSCECVQCDGCLGCIKDCPCKMEDCCTPCTCEQKTCCTHDNLYCNACNDDDPATDQHQNCMNVCGGVSGNTVLFCATCGDRYGSTSDDPSLSCMHRGCQQEGCHE